MKLIQLLEENQEVIIQDFNEYLKEYDYEILDNEILVEQYINNYITSLNYGIQNETENYEQQKEIENKIYDILDKYCCDTIDILENLEIEEEDIY